VRWFLKASECSHYHLIAIGELRVAHLLYLMQLFTDLLAEFPSIAVDIGGCIVELQRLLEVGRLVVKVFRHIFSVTTLNFIGIGKSSVFVACAH
jgi:hypothetical protein